MLQCIDIVFRQWHCDSQAFSFRLYGSTTTAALWLSNPSLLCHSGRSGKVGLGIASTAILHLEILERCEMHNSLFWCQQVLFRQPNYLLVIAPGVCIIPGIPKQSRSFFLVMLYIVVRCCLVILVDVFPAWFNCGGVGKVGRRWRRKRLHRRWCHLQVSIWGNVGECLSWLSLRTRLSTSQTPA